MEFKIDSATLLKYVQGQKAKSKKQKNQDKPIKTAKALRINV